MKKKKTPYQLTKPQIAALKKLEVGNATYHISSPFNPDSGIWRTHDNWSMPERYINKFISYGLVESDGYHEVKITTKALDMLKVYG